MGGALDVGGPVGAALCLGELGGVNWPGGAANAPGETADGVVSLADDAGRAPGGGDAPGGAAAGLVRPRRAFRSDKSGFFSVKAASLKAVLLAPFGVIFRKK